MHTVYVVLFTVVASISVDSCDVFIHILQSYYIANEVTMKGKHRVRIACINFGRTVKSLI